jgi:hypothetical protein
LSRDQGERERTFDQGPSEFGLAGIMRVNVERIVVLGEK